MARVGRERGSESPIPVSPAMAALAGRSAPSTKPCIFITPMAAPYAAPTIAYWTSRQLVAPTIPPTTTPSKVPTPH